MGGSERGGERGRGTSQYFVVFALCESACAEPTESERESGKSNAEVLGILGNFISSLFHSCWCECVCL